jgi:uncharacterized protein YPO0396
MPPTNPDLPLGFPSQGLPGFRLQRLEMLNWGTFHGKIHSLTPDGRWTLLVGENGSGKSTAVDALRTLLVAPRQLDSSFNDAARDAREHTRQKDRTRRSYIRGAWSTASREDSDTAELQYLRKPGEQTVLLAMFGDAQTGKAVTLAQVLWESNEQVHEVYAVAETTRSIREHIAQDDGRELKRRLRDNGFLVVPAYSAYAEKFRRVLHLPGEGAMRVFNQAIGVKEVGDLNQFIRRHMFEPNEVVEFIKGTLKPNFVELDDCWKALKRAERQEELLLPIRACHQTIEAATLERTRLDRLRATVEPFYAWRHVRLLEAQAAELAIALAGYREERAALQSLQTADGARRDEIKDALARDKTEIRIQQLTNQIDAAQIRCSQKQQKALMVQANLRELGRQQSIADEAAFVRLKDELAALKTELEEDLEKLRTKVLDWEMRRLKADAERAELVTEIEHLKQQKGLIPADLTSLRERICAETGVPVGRLPFVGELVQVQEDYAEWRGVLEQLMRGFGISLLVSREDYTDVSGYVKGRRLIDPRGGQGLRLEFFVIEQAPSVSPGIPTNSRFVHGRLDFHPDHRLAGWVARAAGQRFRHICCDTLTEFQHEPYAVTADGLIRNGEHHVKDDRRRLADPSNYVLGWSNEAKLQALAVKAESLGQTVANLMVQLTTAKTEERGFGSRIRSIENVLSVALFAEIDFQTEQAEMHRLTEEREQLAAASQARQVLVARLEEVQVCLDRRRPEIEAKQKSETLTEGKLETNGQLQARLHSKLFAFQPFEPSAVEAELAEAEDGAEVTLESIQDIAGSVDKRLSGQMSHQSSIINGQTTGMVAQMKDFLHEFPEETKRLQATAEYAGEFVKVLDDVQRHDLPTHTERFEKFLGTNLVGDVASLQTRLNREAKDIRDRVESINQTLANIVFTPGTYLEMVVRDVPSGEIVEFKGLLAGCITNTIRPKPEERPRIFAQIQQLMARFDADEVWMRRVTDTRNWLEFRVRVRDRISGNEVEIFTSSQGKSGGQKARLAFALLASAIATQYGLIGGEQPERAFRLVVIDEAFARTDEENSQRALELFRNLGLQMLIVSPFDAKSRIVEDYVDSFHLTTNPQRNDSSIQRASRVQYEALRNETANA